jgi:hypothetical protein
MITITMAAYDIMKKRLNEIINKKQTYGRVWP